MGKEQTPPSVFGEMDDFLEWKKEWKGMPEFVQKDDSPFQSIIVHFENKDDMEAFSALIGQKVTHRTKSIWYPKYNREKPSLYTYEQEDES